MRREPAVIAAGIAQLVSLIIPVLVLFEIINWSDKQIAGFMALVTFGSSFVATLFTRQSVTPVETANEQIKIAVNSPIGTKVSEVVEAQKEGLNAVA